MSDRRARVLDTMTLSYLMKGEPHAVRRLEACRRSEVFVPQPVIAEIVFGLQRLAPSKRRAGLEDRFKLIISEVHRADWDDEVSFHFGATKALLESSGQLFTGEDFDLAIASHAVARGAILVTSNAHHMGRIPGLDLEDWKS